MLGHSKCLKFKGWVGICLTNSLWCYPMTQSFNLEEENPNDTSNISWAVFLSDMDCVAVTALIQPRNFRLDMGQYFCTASGSAEHYGSLVFGTSSFLTKGVKKSFQTVLRRNQAFQGASGVPRCRVHEGFNVDGRPGCWPLTNLNLFVGSDPLE